ncbi:oxygen-independent coproporphyrinogen III oxidase [Primorskyibacter sp. S187A]|uniref:oxygen-independent coproporphyrinogen III oxidase n=1 Tax=Primorskyibacter sp. S187A TaxID=3415130 RepID=UPI003C7C2BC1
MVTRTELSRLGLFDAKVPRYTSYPTAPHFAGGVGASEFAKWIRAIPEGGEISLYIHVPFCRRLCWFCACRTQGTQSEDPVNAYVETLLSEVAAFGEILPKDVRLSRLHWGGGTPTLLKPAVMERLGRAIFDVAPMAEEGEFSVEIDPCEIDAERLDVLADLGMGRASIGVQDFDPAIQETIGRIQSYDATRDAVEMIRARGISSLNADILYGLPHQTKARITESVQKLLSLQPDRVALYGYAHVPWMARRQAMIPSDALPTPDERLDLFETARRLFMWDGYDEIGIDHFGLPDDSMTRAMKAGTLKRNFQGYTDDPADALVGLGASSISRFPQGFAQNDASTSAYTKAVRAGAFATSRGHVFSADDNLRGRMIEALMCDFRISREEICTRFDLSAAAFDEIIQPMRREFGHLINISDEGVFVPAEARPLLRIMARALDAYDLSKAGHSSAI